ncbi:hypothetical protein DITRI_Ditri03aG0083900 [Diplodiscus trichospermus]
MKKMGGFASVNDDILQIILFKLPALSFASAACVRKSWNKVCNRDAVTEVLEKVLSWPIASIGMQFNLEAAHKLVLTLCSNLYLFYARMITKKLGSRTLVITTAACGIIGKEAVTNTLKEWDMIPDVDGSNFQEPDDFNRGIVLTLGFLPGLKVDTIPLLRPKREHQVSLIENFVMDIRNYRASVSGCITAAGIILFGDQQIDMGPVVAEIDCVMPEETVIVGDASSHFMFRSDIILKTTMLICTFWMLLLFYLQGIKISLMLLERQFYATLSTGIMPFGPKLKTFSIDDESADLYIGVLQKKPSSIGPEISKPRTCMAFYKILDLVKIQSFVPFSSDLFTLKKKKKNLLQYRVLDRRDGVYLVVEGVGINPGDTLLLYRSDADTASSSTLDAYEDLMVRKSASMPKNRYSIKDAAGGDNCGVFGGLIFASHCRGGSYFHSFPFYCNFIDAPLAGVVCNKEIGRDAAGSSLLRSQDEEESPARCLLHVCTTVYLVLSYVPPSPSL